MHDSRAVCQETVFWALIVRKMLQLQGDNVPLTPYQGSALDPIHCTFIIFRQLYRALHPGLSIKLLSQQAYYAFPFFLSRFLRSPLKDANISPIPFFVDKTLPWLEAMRCAEYEKNKPAAIYFEAPMLDVDLCDSSLSPYAVVIRKVGEIHRALIWLSSWSGFLRLPERSGLR